jgi:hypothetical protein
LLSTISINFRAQRTLQETCMQRELNRGPTLHNAHAFHISAASRPNNDGIVG